MHADVGQGRGFHWSSYKVILSLQELARLCGPNYIWLWTSSCLKKSASISEEAWALALLLSRRGTWGSLAKGHLDFIAKVKQLEREQRTIRWTLLESIIWYQELHQVCPACGQYSYNCDLTQKHKLTYNIFSILLTWLHYSHG